MVDIKKRIEDAKARMRGRHKDKDNEEISMMVSSFRDLTPDQIRKNYEQAVANKQ